MLAPTLSRSVDPHNFTRLNLVAGPSKEDGAKKARILRALGLVRGDLPEVDDENLWRYYRFLSQNLSFPFRACYPEPTSTLEETLYECTVLELLDPRKYAGDEFSGIFCKTRKGRFEVNLPLVELEVAPESTNFELVEDYWYWFWNWR